MSESGVFLQLKVVPGASRENVAGWLGDVLKVRVRAPAERGKANAAVERLVAEALGVALNAVRITAGRTSPRKTLEISGLSLAEIHAKLSKDPV